MDKTEETTVNPERLVSAQQLFLFSATAPTEQSSIRTNTQNTTSELQQQLRVSVKNSVVLMNQQGGSWLRPLLEVGARLPFANVLLGPCGRDSTVRNTAPHPPRWVRTGKAELQRVL